MNDIDIIYQIHEDKIYLEPDSLQIKVSEIKNDTLATGLLVDLAAKYQLYGTDPRRIFEIINENYDRLDPYTSHVTYINALNNDPRGTLCDFLYEYEGDLAQNPEFITWIHSLSSKDLKIIEQYCVSHEYYEVIDFILKTKNGLY